MSFSEPRYVRCPVCDGDGDVYFEDEDGQIVEIECPFCEGLGSGKILDEQIPEENNSESPLENNNDNE